MTNKQKFANRIAQIKDKNLRACCREISKHYPDFFEWPASLGHHHAFEGGLLAHTLELFDNAENILNLYPNANRDVVWAAIAWHDVAKIWDYKVDMFFDGQYEQVPKKSLLKEKHDFDSYRYYWVNTEYHSTIHHIQGSFGEFTFNAKMHHVNQKLIESVQHAILAHHGPVKEWGSNIRPQSLEATIVHFSDYLSAAYGATAKSDFNSRP